MIIRELIRKTICDPLDNKIAASIESNLCVEYWSEELTKIILQELGFDFFNGMNFDSKPIFRILCGTDVQKLKHLEENVYEQVSSYVRNGCNTALFDMDGLSKSSIGSMVLLYKEIVDYRRNEMNDIVVQVVGRIAYLQPLWERTYGYQILEAKRFGLFADIDWLENAFSKMEEVGFNPIIEYRRSFNPEYSKISTPFNLYHQIHHYTKLNFLAREVIHFVLENRQPSGVPIIGIIEAFCINHAIEHIQMAVINLMAEKFLHEVKIGRYDVGNLFAPNP